MKSCRIKNKNPGGILRRITETMLKNMCFLKEFGRTGELITAKRIDFEECKGMELGVTSAGIAERL